MIIDERVRGRTVLLAGGTSAAGRASARALTAAGAHVVGAGSSRGRLARIAAGMPEPSSGRYEMTASDVVWSKATMIV